ncbi:hypothetical protein EDC96DRAFT_504990 [Choanephora cucurbitarum]|nr:hypothetical protein EDC96DRAFT_504990 [Choanephora cucurbitarum]
MKLFLLFLILSIYHAYAVVIQPLPTRTIERGDMLKRSATIQRNTEPTVMAVERYHKRDDIDNALSMYEFWADSCKDDNNNVKVAVSDLNNLWQTVTTTVYCGNNQVKTVTKTITAKATSTVTKGGSSSSNDGKKGSGTSCNDKCWSDYLWHTYGYGISVAQGFTGIVLMLIGLYLIIFGFSFFRGTLAVVGFVFFALMSWIGLVNNEPLYGYPHNEIVYICVSAGIGLLGALLFIFLYGISLYFIGVDAGIFLAVFILSWKANLVIEIKVARVCFIVGMGIVLAVLILLTETYCVIFCTAFTGAFLFILGLDLFIHTGLINAFLLIFDGNPNHTNVYIMRVPVYVMLAFVIFLTLVSFGWQYYWNIVSKKKEFGVNVEEKAEGKK